MPNKNPQSSSLKKVLTNPLFLAGLSVKLIFLFFCGSSFIRDLFIPFLDAGVLHPTENPWSLNPPAFFPYGSAIYLILFVPRFLAHGIFGSLALGDSPLGLALVKGPLLGLDILLYLVLRRLAGYRAEKILLYYWLNPILFYITYIHGQLDLAAMSFCLFSLERLISRKTLSSALLFGAAILCKFHVVVIIPFLLVFIWNREFAKPALKEIGRWIIVVGIISLLGFIPLLTAGKFLYASTSSPEAARIFGLKLSYGNDQFLFLGVFLVLFTVGRLCLSTKITDRGLVLGSGLIFGSLLMGTFPAPGWFFWVAPFISLFFALYVNVPKSLFWSLCAFYFIYFVGLDVAKINNAYINGFGLTLFQASVVAILFAIWRLSLATETPIQRRSHPCMIGIAGDSGVGKNYLSEVLADIFNLKNTVTLEGDNYHKWSRGDISWDNYTHLNPRANHLLSLAQHTDLLSSGNPIFQPRYDHETGKFTDPEEIEPTKTVIVQGLHSLYLKSMRDEFNLKIFVMAEPTLRMAWKVKRDVLERGASVEKVLANLKRRESDSQSHIAPQIKYADWVIEYHTEQTLTDEQALAGEIRNLRAKHLLWNDAPISELLDTLRASGLVEVKLELVPSDINRITLSVAGNPPASEVAKMADTIFKNLRHLTRARMPPEWRGGLDGINQLLALCLLSSEQAEHG